LKPTGVVEGGRISVNATVEAFEVHFHTEGDIPPVEGPIAEMLKPLDFDSDKPEDPDSPFREAIGKSFTFETDPHSGAITALKGAQAISWAVVQKVEDEKRMRYFIPELTTDGSMKTVLDTLLHLSDEGSVPGGHWNVERHELPIFGPRGQRDHPPLDLTARVETKDEGSGRASFKWSATGRLEGRERKLEGTASWEGGRIVRSEQKDDLSSHEGRPHMVYKLEELPAK